MQQDFRRAVSAHLSHIGEGLRDRWAALKMSRGWADYRAVVMPYMEGFADRAWQRVKQRTWQITGLVVVGALGLVFVISRTLSDSDILTQSAVVPEATMAADPASEPAATAVPDDGRVPEDQAVICIGLVRYGNGVETSFFQRGGESVEATLIARHGKELVDQGYTVKHHDCYGNWQAAADWLTDGQVTLPENANEEIFSLELLKWKQQKMTGSQ